MNNDFISLEKEFAENAHLHKMAILREKMTRYNFDKIISKYSGVNFIDAIIREQAEIKARQQVHELFLRDKETFNKLYEIAWDELKNEIE